MVVYGKKRDEVSPRVTLFKITSRSSCMFDRGRQRSEKSRFLKAYSGLGINNTELLPSERAPSKILNRLSKTMYSADSLR